MPRVIVVGGGLAGMAATAALADAGYDIELFESRPYLVVELLRTQSLQVMAQQRPSIIANTSFSVAASTCSISIAAWVSRIRFGSTRSSTS